MAWLLGGCCLFVNAQELLPYSYYQSQQLNRTLYSPQTRFHTALKPFQGYPSGVLTALDSAQRSGSPRSTWVGRKLWKEHLLEVNKEDYSFYLDYLPDLQVGRDASNELNTFLNTRGVQIGGRIGTKFRFYSSLFENNARFNAYTTRYIAETKIIPGMVNDKQMHTGQFQDVKDWAYATAILNYTPNKYVSFTLGHDKNFIGDGYRSMILSDVAAAYPYLKAQGHLGNVQYTAMWAQFQDLKAPMLSFEHGFRKKWGVFHFLDWNVSDRLSLGFFDAVIWQDADSAGNRGFDVSYLNPIIFLRTIEGMNYSPDNALLGLTGKYKFASNMSAYGQLVIDEFRFSDITAGKGSWANKLAYQVGVRGFDAFKVANLNFLLEYNTARPFMYSQRFTTLNYGHYNQALAHPLGANFREFVTLWNYEYKRWFFQLQWNRAMYGMDDSENRGGDIWRSYNDRSREEGYRIGDGLKTHDTFAEAKVGFVINPVYHLRVEVGGLIRNVKNDLSHEKTTHFTIGLRSSFRNLYSDF